MDNQYRYVVQSESPISTRKGLTLHRTKHLILDELNEVVFEFITGPEYFSRDVGEMLQTVLNEYCKDIEAETSQQEPQPEPQPEVVIEKTDPVPDEYA